MPGIGKPRPLSLCEWWAHRMGLHVDFVFRLWPDGAPCVTVSPQDSPLRSVFRRVPRFHGFPGNSSVKRSWSGPSSRVPLPWETLPGAIAPHPNKSTPKVNGAHRPLHHVKVLIHWRGPAVAVQASDQVASV